MSNIILGFAGDAMLGRATAEALRTHGPAFLWERASPLLQRPSWLLANLECALTVRRRRGSKASPVFFFRAPPADGVAALHAAHVSCVNLANNHVLDFGIAGLHDTLAALDRAGIAHVGAGANLAAASAARLFSLGRLRLAVLGFTDNEPGWAASPTRPGVYYVPVDPGDSAFAALLNRIRAARAQADLVIVSAHWGPNMSEHPRAAARRAARLLVEAGASVVHGHSAHVVQGVELVEEQPVLYDCGGLVDDYAVHPLLRNDWGFLFLLDHERGELRAVPLQLDHCHTRAAPPTVAPTVCARLLERCRELGTAALTQRMEVVILLPRSGPRRPLRRGRKTWYPNRARTPKGSQL
jgi:poly-gamma-glutamate capsule biosynthesis protein CapA/YwtB (metallophosphatase superfamily)